MKNKKILKFLTILISAAIISNSDLAFAKKEKQIQNVEKEENTKTSGEVLKPLTPEERKNLEEQRLKEFFKNLELSEKKDKETIEKNKEKYGDLKKEDLEVKGYTLEEIYFKNGDPILVLEHEKTGAKIVIILVDENEKRKDESYFFRFFEPNNKGLVKFLERCIESKFKEDDGFVGKLIKKYKKSEMYTNIDFNGLEINTNGYDEKNFLKEFFSTLENPEMLKNKELFEKEKEKILLDATRLENITKKEEHINKGFKIRGIPKEIKNVTFEEVKKIFEKTMHPSNLLIIKEMKFNLETIREYLEFLNKYYLENFSRKETKPNPFKKKEEDLESRETKCNEKFKFSDSSNKEFECNYRAISYLDYSEDNETYITFSHKYPILTQLSLNVTNGVDDFEKKLENYVKSLGYVGGDFYDLGCINLYGNDAKLFTKEILNENYIKIFNFILKELKNFDENEIKKRLSCLQGLAHGLIRPKDASLGFFSDPTCMNMYRTALGAILRDNFSKSGEVISKNTFEIIKTNNGKEIKDSLEYLIERIKKDIETFNLESVKKIPINFSIKKYDENMKKSNNYEGTTEFLFPVEFTKNKNNAVLETLSKEFLFNVFRKKERKSSVIRSTPYETSFLGSYIGTNRFTSKEEAKKNNDFYLKDFKKLKITKKDFENAKEELKKSKKYFIEENYNECLQRVEKYLDAIDYYLKHGYVEEVNSNDEKDEFKITKRTTRAEFDRDYLFGALFYKDKEEYFNILRNKVKLYEKYGRPYKDGKNEEILVDKQFVKDYKKLIIDPLLKIFHSTRAIFKDMFNKVDKVTFEEFVETVKSAEIVEETKYEKDQKVLTELSEKLAKLRL